MPTIVIDIPSDALPIPADSPEQFAAEARFLLALKLFELGRISSRPGRFQRSVPLQHRKRCQPPAASLKLCFGAAFKSSLSHPTGERLIGQKIRQLHDLPPLAAGSWKLTAPIGFSGLSDPSSPI
ncbi:UPF0175 family protein [Thiorhodococcus minor]|uniref:Uncharacterized protein n=1 Tax=Thiorhodococcus minor TaxID=57489 RepID=A0A6M0JVW6_9GAMM|nr:hypothetical protein [Thiorhodococcus minor]NEV61329.1 hypothetical protein [Thiorhodococcus minor]